MSFIKNKTFGWWQYPINFPSTPGLSMLVRKYNCKKQGLGYLYRLIYEDLITVSINNHYGELSTLESGELNIETISYQLNYEPTDVKNCLEALKECSLIEFNDKQKLWYIKNVDQFIGTKNNYKKNLYNKGEHQEEEKEKDSNPVNINNGMPPRKTSHNKEELDKADELLSEIL